jgi:hypothetical protein
MSDLVQELRQGSLNNDDYRWKAAARIEQLEAALQKVMIGGNHLATIIGATHPQAGTHPAGALEFYGPGHQYDAWCCWNAIMVARAALEERT